MQNDCSRASGKGSCCSLFLGNLSERETANATSRANPRENSMWKSSGKSSGNSTWNPTKSSRRNSSSMCLSSCLSKGNQTKTGNETGKRNPTRNSRSSGLPYGLSRSCVPGSSRSSETLNPSCRSRCPVSRTALHLCCRNNRCFRHAHGLSYQTRIPYDCFPVPRIPLFRRTKSGNLSSHNYLHSRRNDLSSFRESFLLHDFLKLFQHLLRRSNSKKLKNFLLSRHYGYLKSRKNSHWYRLLYGCGHENNWWNTHLK